MNELEHNKLFNLSKEARKNKDYLKERQCLEETLKKSPLNVKIINALIRNLRKLQCTNELKKWLYILYELKPSGVILNELISLERKCGNTDKVNLLLIENLRINPNSKKIKRRILKEGVILKENMNNENYNDIVELINKSRNIIYSNDEYEIRKDKLLETLVDQSKLICVCLLSEFYVNESLIENAINIIKKYKSELSIENDKDKIKILNGLQQLVKNKKTKRFNWNDFWQNNIKTICDINENIKIFIKYL